MAVGGQNNYPSLDQIARLTRSLVNDDKAGATGTAGEGQILTNSSVTLQNMMDSAIRETYRDVRIMGQPSLIRDNYILYNIPPINSAMGVAVMNPAAQASLQFTGFFDGLEMQPNLLLPSDLILPLMLWEREAGTTNPFGLLRQSTSGLAPRNQSYALAEWEWRGDAIWFHGATTARDIRLRYVATFPAMALASVDWTETFVPIMDSQEAIADKIAVRYGRRLGSPLGDILPQADRSILRLRQQVTRTRQEIDFQVQPYGGAAAAAAGNPATWLY
jgi:hypothetical protein